MLLLLLPTSVSLCAAGARASAHAWHVPFPHSRHGARAPQLLISPSPYNVLLLRVIFRSRSAAAGGISSERSLRARSIGFRRSFLPSPSLHCSLPWCGAARPSLCDVALRAKASTQKRHQGVPLCAYLLLSYLCASWIMGQMFFLFRSRPQSLPAASLPVCLFT